MGLKKLEQLLRVAVSVGNLVSSFPVEQTLHSCCCARYLVSELHREEVKEKKKKKSPCKEEGVKVYMDFIQSLSYLNY